MLYGKWHPVIIPDPLMLGLGLFLRSCDVSFAFFGRGNSRNSGTATVQPRTETNCGAVDKTHGPVKGYLDHRRSAGMALIRIAPRWMSRVGAEIGRSRDHSGPANRMAAA